MSKSVIFSQEITSKPILRKMNRNSFPEAKDKQMYGENPDPLRKSLAPPNSADQMGEPLEKAFSKPEVSLVLGTEA